MLNNNSLVDGGEGRGKKRDGEGRRKTGGEGE